MKLELQKDGDFNKIMIATSYLLRNYKGEWAFTGSAGLRARGYSIIPNDIDIIATKRVCLYLERRYKKYFVNKFRFSKSDDIKSYFGEILCHGIRVQIMSNVHNRNIRKLWVKNKKWRLDIENISLSKSSIPVLKIESELEIARMKGDWMREKRFLLFQESKKY